MIQILSVSEWGWNILRGFFALIDGIVYWLIEFFMSILDVIVRLNLFNGEQTEEFATRVYVFVGIIMVFRLTISLINYLVNPDNINDKETGAGNIAKNVVITFFLIIIAPTAFNLLYNIQAAVIDDNIVPRIVLGTNGEVSGTTMHFDERACANYDEIETESIGQFMSLTALRPFYQINEDVEIKDDKNDDLPIIKEYCDQDRVSDFLSSKFYTDDTGVNESGEYTIDYKIFMSTVCGVVVLLLLISYCMDIAVRTIKLGFLEVMAPIPIVSYIDPKSSKNGLFKKWLDSVIQTWVSLFVRLVVLYFAIYVVSLVSNMNDELGENGLWVKLFLLIGALMFAKQAPKLIEDITGFKLDGLSLRPISKIKEQSMLGDKVVSAPGKIGAAGAAVGMSIIGSVKNRNNAKRELNDNIKTKSKEKIAEAKKVSEARLNANKAKLNDMYVHGKINSAQLGKGLYYSEQNNKKKLAKEEINIKKQTREEETDNFNKKFSNRRPIASGLITGARAAKTGFKSDSKSIADVIRNASQAATNSAKERTYTDNYTMKDRMQNLLTDWADIKKGGTANIVDSRIKELNDRESDVVNALDSLRQQLSAFDPGTIMFDNKGTPYLNPNVNKTSAVGQAAQSNIDQTLALKEVLKDVRSEIKKQTKILDQQGGIGNNK